jgi:hypothetical protein
MHEFEEMDISSKAVERHLRIRRRKTLKTLSGFCPRIGPLACGDLKG